MEEKIKIAFLEAPICEGSPTRGSEKAFRFLLSSAKEIFGDRMKSVPYEKEIPENGEERENLRSLNRVISVSREIARKTAETLENGQLPMIIGGDHSVAMGSIAGLSEVYSADSVAVVYIDGHTDINTEKTTESGFIHGMPLAQAMGLCTDELNIGTQKIHLLGKNLFILGARSIDKGEYPIIREQNVNLYTRETIRQRGWESVLSKVLSALKKSEIRAVHFSFDVDCMDGDVFPATGYRMNDGFTAEEAISATEKILSCGKVRSVDLVEYNPTLDSDGKCLEILKSWLRLFSGI